MDESEAVLKRLEQNKKNDSLNLNNLDLKALPSQLSSYVHLKYLYLDNNKLIFIPEIGSLVQLEELSIENNELTLIPESYYNLKNLKSLNLSKNHLKYLSADLFKNYQQLNILWLNNCELMYLPKEIGCLKQLEKLGLKENNLQDMPQEIGNLSNLKWLNLEKNEIYSIPDSFTNLTNLNYLNLSFNKLEELKDFKNLKSLNILLIRNNLIKKFTDENVLEFLYLNKFDLRENTFIKYLKENNPAFYEQLLKIDNFLVQDQQST